MEIASIWLDARVNLNSVIRDLQQLNTKQFSVDVGVDDRALTNLNKHLDKKVSHLKQVQSYFNSNPLRVRVDDRDLTGLNKKLDAASKGKRTINIGVNASQQDLDKLGETITKSVSAALKKSLSSQIGSAITSAVGGSLNLTIGSVFRGIFEGLGREASRDLSKGIAQGLESAVSGTVGSSGLLGETIAKAISGGITKKLGSETKKELEQLFKDLLGEQDIITASRASRYQRGVQKRKDTQSAREQTNIERREAIRDYRTQSEALSNNLFATEEVRQAYAKGSELRNKLQNQLSAVIGNDAETKRLTTVIDEVSRALNALSEEELGLIKQEAQLKESVEQARERVRKARANADTIAPKTLPNAYREAVVQVFGEELPEHKLPKMVLADNEMRRQNARAAYGAESNAIMMRKDLYDAIAKAKSITDLTEKQRYALFEELQHAKDLGTGSLKGIAANRRGEILGTPVQGSPQELKAIAKELSAYTAEEQLIERNAKLKARRDVQASIDKELRSQSEQRLTNLAGSGGIKFDNLVQKQFDRIKVLLKGVMESAEKSGVSITNEIAPYVARFQSLKQEVTASSDNLAAIPQLSAAELDQLSAKISQDLKSLNDFIAETSSYIKDFVAKTSQQEIQIPVEFKNPEAELVSADSTVQAVARQSALINKESVVKQAQQSIQESKKAQQEISKSQKVEHGLGYAKELATKFRKAHEDLKQAIKRGDKEIAAGLAKIIQENAIEANKEIAAITKDLGDEAKMGTTLGSQLANAKSQVSHASKASKRAIAKYKIPSVVEIEETRKQLSGDGEIEQLRKQRLDFDFLKNNSYINNILKNAEAASDRFDSAYKRFGKQLGKQFESAANNVNSFFEEVNAGGKESTGIIESLAGAAKGMAARFGALLIITTVVGALNQFKDASIETAIAFETLERRVTFASGSFSEGAKNLQFLRKQAKDLRVDLRQTLEGGAGFLSATRDTALEGDPSRQILGAVNQASAVYGMSGEQQNRALLALQQMAGKSVISQEELRQQLGEAIPGAANIAARAMGVTVQEMNKMIESGQVLAEDFLPKFAQQLSAESQSGLTSALDSSQSSLNRFNNSVTELQESTGSALLPLRNFSLNALSTGLEAIVSLAPAIINFLKFLTLWLTKPVWMPALESLKAFKPSLMNLGDVGGAAFANIVKSGRQLISIMGPFLAQFAGFTVAIAAVTALKDAFSDLGGEFRKSADAARQATSDIQKAIGQSSGDIDQQVFEKNARNRASRSLIAQPAVDYVLGALGGRNRTKELKEAKDQVKAINEEMIATNKQLELSRSQEAASKIEQVKSIDKQLEEIRIRRSATIRLNPQDTQSLRQLKQQESALLQARQTTVEPVAKIQKELNARADFLQKAIDRIEQIRATDDTRTQAEDQAYQNQVDNLKKSLEEVKQAQDEFNKSLGESATAFTQMQKGIKSVADRLADMSDRATFSTNKAKTAIAQGILSGQITPGQEQSAQQQVEIAALKQQLQAQIAAFLETRSLLLTDENQARMRDFGVNFSTGRARLATLAEQESSNPKNKYLFEQLGGLQERKLQISDLQSQYAQARANVRKQLVDLTKQVADFYRGIERQAKEQAIETKKLSNQIGASSAQNKLRSALLDGYDTITTQFVDAIIQEIDQQKAISDRAIDTQSQLLQNQFSLQDTLRQGVELSRSLPGQIPPIPVKVDLSSIHDDANVQALNEELQQSIFTTEELNNSLYNAEDIINSSVDLVDDLNKGFDQTTQNTVNTFNELNNVTLGLTQSKDLVGEINDLSQGWNNTLNQSQSQAEGIQGIFQGIIDWILKLVSETQNWLNLLSSGIHTITNPTGVLGGIGAQLIGYPVSAGQTALSFGQGILDKASNLPGFAQLRGLFGIEQGQASSANVLSPVGNAPITSGYGPRKAPKPGASSWHKGIDYGVPVGTSVKAPTAGVVSYVGDYGGGGLTVKLKSIDQQGRQIEQAFLHLSRSVVQVGQQIQQGQEIAKSGDSGVSTGPHLDWRIKINGEYVNPKDFLNSQISIGVNQKPSATQATSTTLNAGAIAKKYGAQSLLIADTQGKIISSYNASQSPASPASTIKLVIGDLVSQRFKSGQTIGVDPSAIAEGDTGKYKAGQSFSASEMVTRMLRDSDNTATNLLIKSLGGLNRVNELAKQSGYGSTHVGNLLSIPGAKGFSNRSTAIDTTTAMARILGSSTQLGQIAKNAIRTNRDFGFKGESGGKIGNNSKVIGNVGIVNVNGKEYLVTSYANVNGNQISNRGIIKNITNDVSKSLQQAQSQQPTSSGKYSSSSSKLSGNFLQEVSALSARLGIPPEWLIAVMGFETGGTYSPSKRNPSSGATGLIQFMPSTARGLGTSTGALAKMSQSQQLKFVEKYLSPYKGRFNSLEDLYMSVLMPTGVGKGPNYKLPGWAYRQNSGLDINKDGAISAAEATSKVRDYLPKGAIAQSQQQQTLSPQSLQSQVANANQVVQSISSQKTVQIQQQSQLDIERQQKELIRTHERNLEQYRRNQRELEDQRRAGRREVTDAAFSADSNPSPSDQFTKRINDINRQYEDYIRERGRQKELLERDLKVAEDALASGGLQPEQEALIQKQVEFNKKGIKELSSEIERLTKLRSQASESAKKLFDREDQQRRGQAGFAQERVEIEVLQGKLQILQEIQKLNPYDERVKTIPALQEQISLKQNDLQLDQDLFQIEQELYSHSIVQEEYDKRAEAIKKANIQRQNEIALTRQQAEEQQRLLELQRNLELRGQLNEGRSQNLQIQQELAQRNFSRSPSLDTSALKAIQEENINAQIEAQRIAYEKQMLELREQLRKSPEIANQTKGLMLNAAFLNQSRLAQFNNSKQDLDGQLRSQQIQKQLDRLSLEEVINAPSINLQKMRAQRIQDTGGNIFQANALNRNAAIQEEEIRYKQEILSLEKQINEARLAGQNIDDSQVKEMYASLEKIHGINLENVNRQFKTFGATLNEVAQGAVSGLAQSLTDLILKGGSLSDVLDNLANTVLSGVLNAGLNSVFGSLFGGLFYDGGLVPNYAGGGIHRAMAKEKSMSGREPMLAVVHRGEMLIPAKRMKELSAIGLGEKQLLGYADGGIVGWEKNENISAMQSMSKSAVSDRASGTTQVNVNYQVERINERNYVDEETFKQGMKKAAEAGANKGYARMSRDINKSTSFRRNAGF